MRRFQTARRSRKRARRSSAPWPTSTPNSRAAASRSRTSRGVMGAGPWASRWGRGYECDPQDSRPSPAVERRAGGGRNDEEYPCCISRSSAPRLRRQSAAGRRKRISGHAPSVPNEARHQIRGRLDDAGCVAPPRNSANYSSSSRLASAIDPPPTLATDCGSGTLRGGARGQGARRGSDERELDRDRRALARLAPRRDAPAQGLGEAAHDVEPEAGAALGARAGAEGLEEVWQDVGRDPGARVAHREAHRLALGRERHLDLHRAPVAVLERVVDQVLDDLLHLHAVGVERWKPGREAAGEPAVARGAREGAGLERREQLTERELLVADGEAPGLQAGDGQRGAGEIDPLHRPPPRRVAALAPLGGAPAD